MVPTHTFSFWSRDHNIPLHKEPFFACMILLFSLCKTKLSGRQVLVWLSTNADLIVQILISTILATRVIFSLPQTSLFLALGWFWFPELLCNCPPTLEPSLCFCLNTFNRTLNFLQLGNIFRRHPSGSKDQTPSMYSSSGNNSTNPVSSSQPPRYWQPNASPQRNNLIPEASFPISNNFQFSTCFAKVSYSPHAPHPSSLWSQAPPAPWLASLSSSLPLTIADLQTPSQGAPSRPQKLHLPAGPSLICSSCC